MADKKLFELELGTPADSDKIVYGKVGSNYKNITVGDFKNVLNPGGTLKTRIFTMLSWNMDTVGATGISLFEEPIPPDIFGTVIEPDQVRGVSAIVRNDSATGWYDLATQQGGSSSGVPLYWISKNIFIPTWTNLSLFRITGGFFDQAGFSSEAFSRGYVTITYVT